MLSKDEAELYDRQIRLWGVNAQSQIRQSRVLMLGFNGVASEVAKILVLAGVDTLTIVDDQPLQESDLSSNLFCRPTPITNENQAKQQYRTHAVRDKLKVLNPLVKVNIDNSSILSKKSEDFKDYDLVTLHSFLTIDDTVAINEICRERKIKFYIVVDYGFFGFMFNDLGSNFTFSYEEYQQTGKEVLRESGEERDPISLGDEATEEDRDDANLSDEDNNNRPKKKRRLYSPSREPVAKNGNEKRNTVGILPYVTFQDMISMKNASTVFCRQTSPVLLVSVAMFKFYSLYKHLPRADSSVKEDDIKKLKSIIESMKNCSTYSDDILRKLSVDWCDNIYGSLSPTCAIIGGVAGQDMIRALSTKDIPINNTFSFDGMSMNGLVEKLGVVDPKAIHLRPVVRDAIQIDDDD